MSSLMNLSEVVDVVIGVDTHVATHSAAVVAARTGAVLGQITVEATQAGYEELVAFADQHPTLRAWAIEGTSSHGAGLTRHLHAGEEVVVELDRPERATRRNGAKSDPLDAVRAAREALSRERVNTPRASGERQALSVLLAARDLAVRAAGDAQRQVRGLLIAAPEPVRARFRHLSTAQVIAAAIKVRIPAEADVETTTILTVVKAVARRARDLSAEATVHEKAIKTIVAAWRPDLLEEVGIGAIVAATVLCAWSHPGRIHSEAAFAMLAGAAPIPANSGQVRTRYRLNRYGDRQLNRALHTIAITRQRHHQPTIDYTARRTNDGKTPREIRRCLKRYIIRDLYRRLENHPPQTLDET